MQIKAQAAAVTTTKPRSVTGSGSLDRVSSHVAVDGTGLRDMLNALPLGVAFVRRDDHGCWRIVADNRAFQDISGEDCAARSADIVSIDFLESAQIADRLLKLSGEPIAAIQDFRWTSGDSVFSRHYAGRLARLSEDLAQLAIRDCTAEVNGEINLRREKALDPLTGLPNRLSFSEAIETRLEQAAKSGEPAQIAVLVVDLQNFSQINDNLGHLAGDELLVTAARRLLSTIRAGDMLARIAGDVFGLVVDLRQGPAEAPHVANRLHAALAAPFQLSGREIHVAAAIGLATPLEAEEQGASLVGNAEFALQRAKRLGRKVEAFHTADAHLARRRFSMQAELRTAIEQDALHLVYQPLIDLKSGRMWGMEALARWTHADLGVVSPTEFIPVAEESGLILDLGRWALDTSCRQLAQWRREYPDAANVSLSVNVSSHQLARDDVVSAVRGALKSSGLPGAFLKIELTESTIVENAERATKVLNELRELDARIAMDDFGTGFSSLASLQRLPIDVLKIDRSFVNDMLHNEDSFEIVNVILSLARALQMETVAEGIETKEQASRLRSLGCNYGQGYLFARPLSTDDLPRLFGQTLR